MWIVLRVIKKVKEVGKRMSLVSQEYALVMMTKVVGILNRDCLEHMEASLAEDHAIILKKHWLAEQVAYEIQFSLNKNPLLQSPEFPRQLSERLSLKFLHLPLDIVCIPLQHRLKKLLISDMDSTMIQQECIDELAEFAGLKAEVARITERAMNGELEFKESLRERVALLKGLPVTVLEETLQKKIQLMEGAKTLVQTMRAHGAICVLVSGGFTFFTSSIRQQVGFHADEANELEVEKGTLLGKVREPILDKHAKLETLKRYQTQLSLEEAEILAVGDGANDLPMLHAAGLGIAYHAKPVVQKAANYRINHSDLTALLYIQGYKKEQFC